MARRRRHGQAHAEGAELFEGISDVSLSLLKIFILLVFFLLIKASVEIFQNILPNQFTGRGGQPHLRLFVTSDPKVPGKDGIVFKVDNDVAPLAFTWPQLQSVLAHINKREFMGKDASGKEVRLASLTFKIERDPTRPTAEFRADLAARSGLKPGDGGIQPAALIGALNRADPARAAEITAFKRTYTFDAQDPAGSHQESIDTDAPLSFDWVPIDQRLGRRPYLWFTVAADGTIPFGPAGPHQVRLSPDQFRALLDGFRGNDGFYVEYRIKAEAKGPGAEPPPEVTALLKKAGFLDKVVRQDKLDISAAPAPAPAP